MNKCHIKNSICRIEFEELTRFATPPEASLTPASLSMVPAHLLMELPEFAAPSENHDPRHLRCSRGRVCSGSSSHRALPAKGSLPTLTQRLKDLSTDILSIPHPLPPPVTSERSCQAGGAGWWGSVNADSHSPCLCQQPGNQMRYFWSFQEPEIQNSELDFIPILSIKLGIAQSYWKWLQLLKSVFKIAFLQNEHFSLSVFCHPANCSPPSYMLHNELLSPNLMARFTLEGSLIKCAARGALQNKALQIEGNGQHPALQLTLYNQSLQCRYIRSGSRCYTVFTCLSRKDDSMIA